MSDVDVVAEANEWLKSNNPSTRRISHAMIRDLRDEVTRLRVFITNMQRRETAYVQTGDSK